MEYSQILQKNNNTIPMEVPEVWGDFDKVEVLVRTISLIFFHHFLEEDLVQTLEDKEELSFVEKT